MTITTTVPIAKPKWEQALSSVAWVNSVAISDNGERVVAATYINDYDNTSKVFGLYDTVCFDSSGKERLWSNRIAGWNGIFAVGISGDGSVVASGGFFTAARNDRAVTGPDDTTGLLMIFNSAGGKVLFDSSKTNAPLVGRVSIVSLSEDGDLVAAAADQLYVFKRTEDTYEPIAVAVPSGDPVLAVLGKTKAVAIHPSGAWLAACNEQGQILVATIADGAINRTILLTVDQEPIKRSRPDVTAPVRFLSVLIAGNGDAFVAGGSDVVYRGSLRDVMNGVPPVRYDAGDANAPFYDPPTDGRAALAKPNVRWTAISGDGATFAAVANRLPTEDNHSSQGELLIFDAGSPEPRTRKPLPHNPNGISMDHEARIIAVADGYPVGKPGTFYRFDFEGNLLWTYPTPNMNWPIAVAAKSPVIAAGGDDGRTYYFLADL